MAEDLGLAESESETSGQHKAPMPGVVIDRMVEVGDKVKSGDTLLLIESMKLQIEIKSEIDGIVATLPLDKGAGFNKGDTIVSIEAASEVSQ